MEKKKAKKKKKTCNCSSHEALDAWMKFPSQTSTRHHQLRQYRDSSSSQEMVKPLNAALLYSNHGASRGSKTHPDTFLERSKKGHFEDPRRRVILISPVSGRLKSLRSNENYILDEWNAAIHLAACRSYAFTDKKFHTGVLTSGSLRFKAHHFRLVPCSRCVKNNRYKSSQSMCQGEHLCRQGRGTTMFQKANKGFQRSGAVGRES